MLNTDLKELRLAADMSQQDLAERLAALQPDENWDQTKVSRYERNPLSMPAGALLAMLHVLGQTEVKVAAPTPPALDVGDPFFDLRASIKDLIDVIESGAFHHCPRTDQEALKELALSWRKPVVALSGKFDAGKTTIINTLLGAHVLPASYQPTTWIPTYIHHIEDRPQFLEDQVLVMGHGFNPAMWRDRDHLRRHLVKAGSFDLLKRSDEAPEESDGCALVFLDAPVLRGCTLLDMPGFGESDDLDGALVRALPFDAAIYADPCTGFMDGGSLGHLAGVVKVLNLPGSDWAERLIIAATHAHAGIADDAMSAQILPGGAMRAARQLFTFDASPDSLQARMVPFDPDHRASELVREAESLLGELAHRNNLASARVFADSHQNLRQQWINHRERNRALQSNSAEAVIRADQLEAERESYLADVRAAADAAKQAILHHRQRSIAYSKRILNSYTVERVENIVRQNFEDKKDAQKNAATFVGAKLEKRLRDDLETRISEMRDEYEALIEKIEARTQRLAGDFEGQFTSAFNARARFLGGAAGGLFGAAGVGLTAAYAATLGNLGAYILVTQAVGVLSSLGISVGGGSAAVGAIAAIGGPITLGVGAIAGLTILGVSLAPGSWQPPLAKMIHKQVVQPCLIGAPAKGERPARVAWHTELHRFWDQAEQDIDAGVAALMTGYDEQIAELRDPSNNPTHYRLLALHLDSAISTLDAVRWPKSAD